jgi:UDP-N-acetylmuramate dehydrogenase
MDQLYTQLKTFGRVKLNERLSKHTTFKIGGPARYYIEVVKNDKIIRLLNYLSGEGIKYFILGGGANTLFPEEYDGVVVRVKSEKLKVKNDEIDVEAGVNLFQVVNLAAQNFLTGMEWGVGIPGTIGGAVRGNAGAFGGDISKNLDKVKVWRDGEVIELNNKECQFGYRSSVFKKNKDVVLSACFKLAVDDKIEIAKKMQEYGKQRSCRITSNPTCGCFFKNIKIEDYKGDKSILDPKFIERGKVPAGWLIEQADCAGMAQEKTRISNLHSNIIENTGNATQSDILVIVEEIKNKVYNKFGVWLEEEVEIVR